MVLFEEVIWLLLLLICKQEGALSTHLHTYANTYIYICCCFPLKYSQMRTYRRACFHKCRNLFWNRVLAQNASFRIWGIEHVETPNLLMTHDSWPRLRFHVQGRLCHNLCFWYWTLLSLGESERGPSGWVHSLTVAASCRNSRVGLPRTWVWLGRPRATSLLHLLPQNQYFPLIIWNMSRKSTCKRFRWSYN